MQNGSRNGGTGFEIEYFIKPHAGRDPAAHLHQWWTEEFAILVGSARYMLAGKEQAAQAGDVLVFPSGIPHIHPWNVGDTELYMRQIDRFDHPSPVAVRDTLNVYATLYGLARAGKVNRARVAPSATIGGDDGASATPRRLSRWSPPAHPTGPLWWAGGARAGVRLSAELPRIHESARLIAR